MLFDESFLRRLEALRLAVRRTVAGRREGDRAGRNRGGSAEFMSYRSYSPGDDFRRIDWNLYGRLGRLYVKEFTREEALTVRLFVDTTLSMAPKFDFARRLGAALALVAEEEAATGLLAEVEGLALGSPFAVPPVPRGLAIVVSDLWDASLREALLGVRAEKAVIHVLSPDEIDPPFAGKVRLVDAETGESRIRFVGDEEKTRYHLLLEEHAAGWKKWCFDHEINYLRCSSDAPFEEVVQVYLREAGILE